MRVISGTCRGKKLRTLEGMTTRPTTDRVKESVFNIIQFDIAGRRVLDLFAGSGQMAIEALSRGADQAVLVEQDARARRIISQNLAATGLSDRARLVAGEALAFLAAQPPHSFDLIFLDPPYGGKLLSQALNCVEKFDILPSGGIIVCESAAVDNVVFPARFSGRKEYRYGASCITIIRG